jgi:PTS system fructose-specific IIB component
MGVENELTQPEIDAAEVVILAADIAVERAERFDKIRRVQIPVQAVLKSPEAVFAKL